MNPEDQPPPDLDPIGVRRGSRVSHRMAWSTFGFGVLVYGLSATAFLALDKLGSGQAIFSSSVTLPTDTALALLGLCATVLIALVAALWAADNISDAELSRGRRRALTIVTLATGLGSVIVGAAGALHRSDDGWNFVTAPVIFCLGLVLAYITADVAFIVNEDRSLEEALRRHDADDRKTRLRIARENWLLLSRTAKWAEVPHPVLTRLGQTTILLALSAVVLTAALAAIGGQRAITGYLGWCLLDVAAGLLAGQLATHYIASTFVTRRWESLMWCCLAGLMYLLFNLLGQLLLLEWMWEELPRRRWGELALILVCWLVPPLMCLLGLTVSPRRWRRFRPMTQIRWSVISAIGREIELVDKGSSTDTGSQRTKRLSFVSRLMRAVRRATGAEEVPPQLG
jgi:hypothetical protein